MPISTARVLIAACCAAALGSAQEEPAEDPIKTLVDRLDLERYKATIKGLTAFGDRRQGTDRNRAAVDWIETQLKSYGCTNTARIHYDVPPPAPAAAPAAPNPITGPGGSRRRGVRGTDSVNNDPLKQPDEKLRQLNSQPSKPGVREEVYCTKIGSAHPEEMYIVGAHMDGIGWGEAANDDGSGTALVMELARIFSSPDVRTERSIRFTLWNSEEGGLRGARADVDQRKDLQGKEQPAGSGQYPEPKWLGMIEHDMMLFDHGMPRKDGTISKEQRPEADVNIEYQMNAEFAQEGMLLAHTFQLANERYASDYPANCAGTTCAGAHTNAELTLAIRKRERVMPAMPATSGTVERRTGTKRQIATLAVP